MTIKRFLFGGFLLLPWILFGIPEFSKTEVSAGVAVFDSVNLSSRNYYVARSLPLMLLVELEAAGEHQFSADELDALRGGLIEAAVDEQASSLLRKQAARDALLFDEDSTEADYVRLSGELEVLREEYETLRNLDPQLITAPESLPVLWTENSEESRLFDPVGLNRSFESSAVDFLVYGTVEEFDNYLYIEARLYNRFLEQDVAIIQTAGGRDELDFLVEDLAGRLLGAILARDRASLSIVSDPSDAFIYVDEDFYGVGEVDISDLEPGSVEVTVRREGYRTVTAFYDLQPGTHLDLDPVLDRVERERIQLITEPAGADIYLDSVWLGRTPLEMERPEGLSRMQIRLEGYQSLQFTLDPLQTGNLLEWNLSEEMIDYPLLLEEKRTAFYNSLAIFSASLVLPLYCQGAADALSNSYSGRTMTPALVYYGTTLHNIFPFSLTITAGTLVNTIVRLLDYLAISSESFNY